MRVRAQYLSLSSYDEMFGADDEVKVEVVGEQIKDVALSELHPFKNHNRQTGRDSK